MAPLYWYFPLANQHDSSAIFSQYLGSTSLIAMGIVQFLATRIKGIETVFGSLDRIYILHKWLAVGAIITAALHDTMDADIDGIGIETKLTDIAETFGEVGYYGLLILGLITIISFIPYHYWKWSHRFMGFFFAMAAFHFIFILKPYEMSDPVGIYVLCFCILGIVSYIYLLIPKNWLSSTTQYEICAIKNLDHTTEIKLRPLAKGIKHQAGQFAFITFDSPALQEAHPFTISTPPNENREITFTIKALGAYTAHLQHGLKIGNKANISRAFGRFTLPKSKGTQVWIAAGIGITPFLAWAQTLKANHPEFIRLYYCNYSLDKALYLEQLRAIDENLNNFELCFVSSRDEKRLNAKRIKHELKEDFQTAEIYFCGPNKMRESLNTELVSLGLRNSAFHYEEFEIRSGIGLCKAVQWTLKRLGRKVAITFSAQQDS